MIYTLALHGSAPKMFSKTSSHQVPARAILFSSLCMLPGVLLNYLLPERVFLLLSSMGTFPALWIWGTIVVLQMRFRRTRTPEQIAALKYPTIFYPYANYFALAGLIFVAVMLGVREETRIALVSGSAWLVLLYVIYKLTLGRQNRK